MKQISIRHLEKCVAEDASGRSSARMQRVVIDTNVYIDWINEGQYEAVLFQRDSVKYLSAVVIMELSAGAFSVRDRRRIGAGSGRFTLTHKHPFISANGRA